MTGIEYIKGIVEKLSRIPNRGATSSGEKEAARIVQNELESFGYPISLETFPANKKLGWCMTYYFGLMFFGLLTGLCCPFIGLLIAIVAFWLFYTHMLFKDALWRHLPPVGTSINVIGSKILQNARQTVILTAHIDAGQAAWFFNPKIKRFFAKHYKDKKSVKSPMYIPMWIFLLSITLLLAKTLGAHGAFINWWHYISLALFAVAAVSVIQMIKSPQAPGATDNATGVGAMLEIAKTLAENPLQNSNLIIVGTGSEETGLSGMRDFIKRHRAQIEALPAYFINFESIGGGRLCAVGDEGSIVRFHMPPFLNGLAKLVSRRQGFGDLKVISLLAETDSCIPAIYGYDAMCFIALDELGIPLHYHETADLPDAVDYDLTKKAADLGLAICLELDGLSAN